MPEHHKEENEKTLSEFISAVSGGTPTPGGGSVSAFVGSLASALVQMVANLTLDRRGFEEQREGMIEIRDAAQSCCGKLLAAVPEDIRAYQQVMEAYRLPRSDEQAKERRTLEIQKGMKKAADVPFHVAETCVRVLEICVQTVKDGNRNAVTDGGVGALLAHAAMEAAILNVRVNLSSLPESAKKGAVENDLQRMQQRGGELKEEVMSIVKERMSI